MKWRSDQLESPMTRPTTKSARPRKKRMARDDREAQIVKEAIAFFADHGFEGKTRDLAKRIGVTQPLLYRYFSSKEKLIERVYQKVFVSRWKPEWETLITDRSRPLDARLTQFYREYADAIYDYTWVRIFMFAGLKGMDLNDRWMSMIRTKILVPIALELRHDAGDPSDAEPCEEEIELIWSLHGMFFYRVIRHFIYGMPLVKDMDAAIANDVAAFTASASDVVGSILRKTRRLADGAAAR